MAAKPSEIAALGGPGTRYNVLPSRYDCPRCFARNSLSQDWSGRRGPIDCSSCAGLFNYEAPKTGIPEALAQTAPALPASKTAPPEKSCADCGAFFIDWASRCEICRAIFQREQREAAQGERWNGFR